MSDEYLWDRSGPPDPEIERLEGLLGRLQAHLRRWSGREAATARASGAGRGWHLRPG